MANTQKTLTCACGKHSYSVDKEVIKVTCWECVHRSHQKYCERLEQYIKNQKKKGIILDKE